MTQLDVTLTDYAVSAECALFSFVLFYSQGAGHPNSDSIAFFLSLAIAAATGGTVHGFFADEKNWGYKVLWRFTLVVIGVSAFFGLRIGAAMLMPTSAADSVNTIGGLFLFIYIFIALLFWQDYRLAIIGYFPSILWLGIAFVVEFHKQGSLAALAGCLGIGTMVIASAVQQLQVAVSRRYFDHNALYHVLQAAGLWMVFAAIRP
jgi:hypothetical protein